MLSHNSFLKCMSARKDMLEKRLFHVKVWETDTFGTSVDFPLISFFRELPSQLDHLLSPLQEQISLRNHWVKACLADYGFARRPAPFYHSLPYTSFMLSIDPIDRLNCRKRSGWSGMNSMSPSALCMLNGTNWECCGRHECFVRYGFELESSGLDVSRAVLSVDSTVQRWNVVVANRTLHLYVSLRGYGKQGKSEELC